MKHIKAPVPALIETLITAREGESRIGQKCLFYSEQSPLSEQKGPYAVFGIPEDIGPRANFGRGGASLAWQATLQYLLNIQSNRFFDGRELIILGEIDCADLLFKAEDAQPEEMADLLNELDARVEEVAYQVTMAGKTPVIVGGGHNNSYPIIRGVARGLYESGLSPSESINCVNLDAHADLRATNGRHSGNGFSYARQSGHLLRYAAIGLHESHNNEFIFKQFDESPELFYNTYDSYVRGEKSFEVLLSEGLGFVSHEWRGVEVDLDCIAGMPSSAMNPAGLSLQEARQFVSLAARMERCAYLHLAEGAPPMIEGGHEIVGKANAAMIIDFVKANREILTQIDMEYTWM